MITLLDILRLHAWLHPDRSVLVTDDERFSSRQLYSQVCQLAYLMLHQYGLHAGETVALLCRNHLIAILLVPALMRLGVHIRLLSTDMPASQLASLVEERCRLLVYDEEVRSRCLPDDLTCQTVTAEELLAHFRGNVLPEKVALPRADTYASLSVFTGGTSGSFTEAARSSSVHQFLAPFLALIRHVGLLRYKSVLIALPLYHGFGLSTLIVSLVLGKKVCLLRHFQPQSALALIRKERVEVLPVVPAILSRLWQSAEAAESLQSVRCILSGGDHLPLSLSQLTQQRLGPVLFNLYGTSEAGFFVLAKPQDLAQATHEGLLGRPIFGVRCDVREPDAQGVGTLWVRSAWAMTSRQNLWQNTGDLVSRDANGFLYHHGRSDRMVVCGGVNVYLDSVERVLLAHPSVANARVYPVAHPDFGQVLHANVELFDASDSLLTSERLRQWLSSRLSRAEMPHDIVFAPLELLSTGKVATR